MLHSLCYIDPLTSIKLINHIQSKTTFYDLLELRGNPLIDIWPFGVTVEDLGGGGVIEGFSIKILFKYARTQMDGHGRTRGLSRTEFPDKDVALIITYL